MKNIIKIYKKIECKNITYYKELKYKIWIYLRNFVYFIEGNIN